MNNQFPVFYPLIAFNAYNIQTGLQAGQLNFAQVRCFQFFFKQNFAIQVGNLAGRVAARIWPTKMYGIGSKICDWAAKKPKSSRKRVNFFIR